MQQVWEIMRDWNTQWDIWKTGHFATLQTENMEGTTQETFKKIQKLQRELKVGRQTARVPSYVLVFVTWIIVVQYHWESTLRAQCHLGTGRRVDMLSGSVLTQLLPAGQGLGNTGLF